MRKQLGLSVLAGMLAMAAPSLSQELPSGTILAFVSTTAPIGFLVCDGTVLKNSAHPRLAQLLGRQFCTAAKPCAEDEFAVPDLRGRTVIGAGQGNGLTDRPFGMPAGEESHTLTSAEMPSHFHDFGTRAERVGGGTKLTIDPDVGSDQLLRTRRSGGGANGRVTPFTNLQPSLALTYIIKD